jgi:hypothetical protein
MIAISSLHGETLIKVKTRFTSVFRFLKIIMMLKSKNKNNLIKIPVQSN